MKYSTTYVQNSPAFVYYLSRLLHNWQNEDSGAYVRDTFKVGADNTKGVAEERDFPYNPAVYNVAPPEYCYTAAKKYCIAEYYRLKTLENVKDALANALPISLGFTVFSSFESIEVANTGIMPMPKSGESILGGHNVVGVGYEDTNDFPGGGYLEIKNSWSDLWGDKGYFKMPYQFFLDGHVDDAWTTIGLRSANPVDPIHKGCSKTSIGKAIETMLGF
jgi:C1A family cysteine protease